MSKQVKIVIPPNEHVFIAGRTQSGKTYLERKFLSRYKNVAILDTKGKFDWPEIPEKKKTLVTRLDELSTVRTDKIIYRPEFQELNLDCYDTFFFWVYMRGHTIVGVDEAMNVSPNPLVIPEWYKGCLTRGAELGVGVWSLSQRPSGIASVIMSECSHFFCFDLNLEEDRKKVAKIAGVNEFLTKPSEVGGKYSFWYYNFSMDNAVLMRLGGDAAEI